MSVGPEHVADGALLTAAVLPRVQLREVEERRGDGGRQDPDDADLAQDRHRLDAWSQRVDDGDVATTCG